MTTFFLPIHSKGYYICPIAHTTVYVIPVVEHWLEREIAQWIHQERFIPRVDGPSRFNTNIHDTNINMHYLGAIIINWYGGCC